MTMNILIRNGRVVDPSQGIDAKLDVLIEDGVVSRIDKKLTSSAEVLDATGFIVTPGFIDLHTHLREPGHEHKETIATGTRAAASTGTIAMMLPPGTPGTANDDRIEVNTIEAY